MTLHVNIQGSGPDLVLLHGWALHGGVFDHLLPSLIAQYRVHVIDLPGHGQSEFDANISTMRELAETIAPYVPTQATVLGWSLGGQIALQLATQMPLRALILVSTTPKFVGSDDWPQGMPADIFAAFFAKLQDNIRTTVLDFLNLQVRGDSNASTTLTALKQRLLQHPPAAAALQFGMSLLRDVDLRAQLSSINVPALVIAGEHDRITHPRAAQYLAAHLPHAQYQQIKRAGHAGFISHREEFLTMLLEFLAQQLNVELIP